MHLPSPDPTHPLYHFSAPTGWMNDPNGTVFHGGYYHVFYQWNPFGDTWGSIHWGHARSRDLVHWEHLPVALAPSANLGEEHCFSGCLSLRENQPPILFYTAIGPHMDVRTGAQQWAAIGDDQLIAWQKHPRNPMLTTQIHNGMDVFDWRDPFVFRDNDQTYLLLGGKLSKQDGGAPVVLLYQADDPTLENWTYRGILFHHPDLQRVSVECANLFKAGEEWVLLLSTHQLVEYFIGHFDPEAGTFTLRTSGLLDASDQFYATNLLTDNQQRTVCFGWLRGFAPGRGWSGCLSLPRILTVENGELHQTPVPELERLRGKASRAAGISLGETTLPDLCGDALEVRATLSAGAGGTLGLRLLPENGHTRSITLTCSADEVRLNEKRIAHCRGPETEIHLFLDRSVVEVFVDKRAALTCVLQSAPGRCKVEFFASETNAILQSATAWEMQE